METKEYQEVEIEDVNWEIFSNVRHDEGDFEAVYHCHYCDPEGVRFNPKLVKIKNVLVCGHCISNITKALNESTLIDCRKGERH